MARKSEKLEEQGTLRSVGRALDLLTILGHAPSAGLTVGDLAKKAGISKSTAFLLLQTLVARQFVADLREGNNRRYRLGPALAHLGRHISFDLNIGQVADPILQKLTKDTGLTARLAVSDENYAVTISQVDPPGPFRMTASLGQRELPHCSSLGKALLFQAKDSEVREIAKRIGLPRRTSRTITSAKALLADLHIARERGYALDDEEDNLGVACIGAPIFDRTGKIIAAISVTGMKQNQSQRDFDRMGQTVKDHALQISGLMGYA
jgi:IclR family transcriptional regulator, acetate operon repressor